MAARRDVQQLVRALVRAGWNPVYTKNGHYKAYPPDGGQFVVFSSTPRSGRALDNIRAALKRSGWTG